MKIYFEDGKLVSFDYLPIDRYIEVNAGSGVHSNINVLDYIKEHTPDAVIYTNSIIAFDNKYAWNEELKLPELYIRVGEHGIFTRIDKIYPNIREVNNLAKMWLAGMFGYILSMRVKIPCSPTRI